MKKIDKKPKSAENWIAALELVKKDTKSWEIKGDKIVKRYRDERTNGDFTSGKKYNILWSNIQTLFPAVYSRKPKAQCDRRYKDKDPVGRTAAQILERSLQYEIDHYNDYDSAIRNALRDRLLPGRGVSWVRYEQTGQITDDVEAGEATEPSDAKPQTTEQPADQYEEEYSPCDYVFWKDFRMSPARTWEEVTWVARRVYMEKEAGIKRFGDDFKNVPLSHEPIGLEDMDIGQKDNMKKAIVWEIYNKPTKTVIWVAENYQNILDERKDPLELDCFFPCPKPLFATLTTESLIPVADYLQYQDQAMELDQITDRIGRLVDACKVVGIYDASQPAIERMLNEGYDNSLIPVDSWAMLAEKGGLKGSVDWFPLEMVVNTLTQMYQAREQTIQVIYAVTGLSDIIRGASQENETATAQQIKSNFASLRLKEIQNSVAVFASEMLNIKAQIMCNFYKPETLIEMSGIMGTEDAQFAQPAIQLLKNGKLRDFRIEIASDSLVELDERGEQESRTQFLGAVGGFLKEAIQAPPELAPLMGEMLLFGVRGFKVGRDIENAFDEAMAQMKQPKPPTPNPEQVKAQAAMQSQQMQQQHEAQMEQMKAQTQAQLEQVKSQANQASEQARMQADQAVEQARAQATIATEQAKLQYQFQVDEANRNHAMQMKEMELQHNNEFERWRVEYETNAKIVIAELQAKTTMQTSAMSANNANPNSLTKANEQTGAQEPSNALASLIEAVNTNTENLINGMNEKHTQLVTAITRPKQATLSNGKTVTIN